MSPAEFIGYLAFLIPPTAPAAPQKVLTVARILCAEAGANGEEVNRVGQVMLNRANMRETDAHIEATRPYQFAQPSCQGRTAKWLNWQHIYVAHAILSGIMVDAELQGKVTHFATRRALRRQHRRCPGNTVSGVWRYSGLHPVLRTSAGHVFFKRREYRHGCPPTTPGRRR